MCGFHQRRWQAICLITVLSFSTMLFAQNQTLIFPQIADGEEIQSEIILTNPGHQEDSGTIYFRDGNGEPLPLVINGTEQNSVSYLMPPVGVFRVKTDGSEATKVGYAVVVSKNVNSDITGSVVYNFNGFEVSMPNSAPSPEYQVFVERNPLANSGVAFANPSDKDITISLFLLNQDGTKVEENTIDLPAGHQLPRFITEIFQKVGSDFTGSVQARSDSTFAMVGLRQRANGSLAILSGSLATGPISTLTFAQIADGGGIRSEIILINPGIQQDSGTIFFRDGNGQPLSLVIDGTEESSVPYSISPGGVLKVQTDGAGATKAGYALVISDNMDSQITGNIVYSFNGFEVSVPNSPMSKQYHVFSERNPSANSGIAFANPSSKDLSIALFLRDQDGTRVEERTIDLLAGHQLARFITEIFQKVGSDFRGSVHAYADNEFSMVGLRQKVSGSLAILSGSTTAGPRSGVLMGSLGGELASEDQAVQLQIPEGALAGEAILAIKESTEPLPGIFTNTSLQRVWELEPSGLQFNKPVGVTWDYRNLLESFPSSEQLRILHWDGEGTWANVESATNDVSKSQLKFEIDQFSFLGLSSSANSFNLTEYTWRIPTLNYFVKVTKPDSILNGRTDLLRRGFDAWQEQTCNLSFQEVFEEKDAQIIVQDSLTLLQAVVFAFLDQVLYRPFDRLVTYGATTFPLVETNLEENDTIKVALNSDVLLEITSTSEEEDALLLYVAMHEIGHAIGIAHHSYLSVAVMSEYDGRTLFNVLQQDDIGAVQSKYGPACPTQAVVANGTNPVISGDGSVIAYVKNGELFMVNFDGTNDRQVTAGVVDLYDDLTINTDGSKVAFPSSSNITGENPDGNTEIFWVDTTTGSLRQLTKTTNSDVGGGPFRPSISGDGSKIVFQDEGSIIPKMPISEPAVFSINSDGTGLKRLSPIAPDCQPDVPCHGSFEPKISADGSKVVFYSRETTSGDDEIFVVNSDGAELRQLTFNNLGEPSTIDDTGSRIAFRAGQFEIAVMNTDGTGFRSLPSPVTSSEQDDVAFVDSAISGNGSRVIIGKHFHPGFDPGDEFYVVSFDGTGLKKFFSGNIYWFSVAGKGTKIALGGADGQIYALQILVL
ncbi:matrixin family metalloprotease [Acidobacteria bacterium AH-259-A15]|nr:matrixin family metalloprotease [Acidobacteria bacterium AH-259-A15]